MAVAALLLQLVLAATTTTAIVANPPSFPDGTEFEVRRMRMVDRPMRAEDSALPMSDHVIQLKRSDSVSVSSIYVQAMRKQAWRRTEADVKLSVSQLVCHDSSML